MTTDPIAAAIDHIRSITPQNDPWTGQDVADGTSGEEPVEADYAIATILNAVVSGQLIHRASRDEMLAQVRRGEGFATAGAEARWIADNETGVYDTDAPDPSAAARALIEPLNGYTPGPWQCSRADLASYDADTGTQVSYLYPGDGERVRFETDNPVEDARLAAAAPDLRDMVATLADALEAERARAKTERDAALRREIEEEHMLRVK